ncbi:MAG: tRNA epoxyqueuosine(34) reductase QueG [Alphaproteobacteria bacterium]|nr:tRNA epoxyqueuosine(34) reductase QueG [Alphaproteobacteria bacterium]
MAAPDNVKTAIIAEATAQGFDVCRIVDATTQDAAGAGLRAFVDAQHHGQMQWMETRMDERAAPQKLWPEAQSIIMLGVNYGPDSDPLAALQETDKGVISVYAQRRDYHDVIKKKLKALARAVVAQTGAEVKVFVDTAPVMEKPLAMRAGLGWQGKHTNLVSRDFGSWLFLGSVFTTLDLPPDDTEADHCGACTACLDICPTNAFPAPYKIDARRCISYLTIEHKGMIERELRPLMGNHIYGCDDCLAACPWNKFAQKAEETKLALQSDYDRPDLIALSKLDDAAFRIFFAGTPIKRAGRDNFIRNVLMALGNMDTPTPAHIAAVRARLEDEAELVCASAIWALGQMTDMSGAEIRNMVGARGPLVDEELAQLGN